MILRRKLGVRNEELGIFFVYMAFFDGEKYLCLLRDKIIQISVALRQIIYYNFRKM